MSSFLRSSSLLAALVVASVLLSAQTDPSGRVRIDITGAAPERRSDLTAFIDRTITTDGDSLSALVRRWYAGEGFLHAAVDVAKTGTGFLVGGSPAGVFQAAARTIERMANPEASNTMPPDMNTPAAVKGFWQALNEYRASIP